MSKTALMITIAILVLGTAFYVGTGMYKEQAAGGMGGDGIYDGMRIKAAYAPTGELKLFILAPADELAKLPAAEGRSTPTDTALVIGAAEAQMMRDEALFSRVGDEITGLFGIDTAVAGILAPTNSTLDDAHFVSARQFETLGGEEGRIYVKMSPEGMPKFFYRQQVGEDAPAVIELAEGDLAAYRVNEIGGVLYQPVIIGAKEAEMMREEKLFTNVGDTIPGFFGQDVVVVGVMKQTNTALDMMHVLPLPSEALA